MSQLDFAELHRAGAEAYYAGRFKDADRYWRRAIKREPRAVSAHSNRGVALHQLGQFHPALICYQQALDIEPDYAEAYSNRAMTLLEINCYVEALAAADRALELKPDYVEATVNRGAVQKALGRLDEALATADRALLLAPNFHDAWVLRGQTLIELRRVAEARQIFEHMLEHVPSLNVCILAGACRQHDGDHAGAIQCYDRALAIKPHAHEVLSNKIFSLDFIPTATVVEQQEARRQWWLKVGRRAKKLPKWEIRHPLTGRITVGYVSADYRHHSAATAFWPVISNHDKSQFEVICYSFSTRKDDLTEEFKRAADKFVDVTRMNSEQMARQVRADGVDILVDLSGHSAGNRLDVFALKPAPVQVTAWGYGTGTGLPTIDWLFSDPVLIPEADRPLYAEKICDLPCAIMSQLPAREIPRGIPPVLANGFITFGVFQRVMKVSDQAVELWAKILHAVPDSRLLMKDGSFDAEQSREAMRSRFALYGIPGKRMEFLGQTTREQHLAAFSRVDISLDPIPHNGGVSTWDALHMGVPVITMLGTTAPGRISAAILTSIGMEELIAENGEDYAQTAAVLAGWTQELIDIRRELPGKIMAMPSGNAVLYTRAVEQAYRTMLG